MDYLYVRDEDRSNVTFGLQSTTTSLASGSPEASYPPREPVWSKALADKVRRLPCKPRQYVFEVAEYSEYFSVMAETADEALAAIKKHVRKERTYGWEEWKDATVDNLPDKYYIKTYEMGQVADHEHA